MKTIVLLSGCGVYDGTEIHEAVLTLLSLSQKNIDYICAAPNIQKHHVINHTNGEESKEIRHVLNESARISRGEIISISEINKDEISSLVIPGGFGVAKNLSNWAFKSADCTVLSEVKDLILHCVENKKPIVSLCISPTLIAKSLEKTNYSPSLTLGHNSEKSEYNISDLHKNIESLGAITSNQSINQICVDENLKIISAPCYMMNANINEVFLNIEQAINKLHSYLSK